MACMAAARDDHDICDACCEKCLEGIVDHRFIVDREQVLVGYFCEGVEAGTCAACEDNAFHVILTFQSFAPLGQGQIGYIHSHFFMRCISFIEPGL